MKELLHKQVCSRGGKNSWKNKTKEEKNKIMKDRWIIRKLKNNLMAKNND